MKKMLVGLMVAVFCGCGAFAQEETFSDILKATVQTGEKAAVLALLGSENCETAKVYLAATRLTPKEDRLAYIETIDNAISHDLCRLNFLPKGAELNAALVAFYSVNRGSASCINRFDESCATKEECIAYYELILKNVALNDLNKGVLGKIKGDLLKLKDI